ncbi:hypothetical protein FIBSPDRAFT_1046618 [Athelia psychrophila]|uniref:Uncharacterized protein n=1 Tax=Athelia psychrophila TaxID=1759441 RepID=A0A166GJM6_9AGAM|nr:hypothetical protein FIBSPDRAFT_1046618 [Fibularhizoctonia sp. CBS 109695]
MSAMYSLGRNVNAIRAAVVEQEATLAGLDDKIAQLMEERAQATRDITLHRAFYAPIRHLPLDLLCRIFTECLPPGPETPFITWDVHSAPLNLTGVCRKWRETALSMPLPWTSLCLRNMSGPLYKQLVPYLPRVRVLKLKVGTHTSVPTVQSPTQIKNCTVPILETFIFESKYDMVVIGEEKEAEISALLHNAPRLRSFSWKNDDDYRLVPPCTLDIPWSQLSHLQLSRMLSHADILGIFSQTPLLETCAFGLVHIPSQLPTNMPAFGLPRLLSFYIKTTLDPGPLFDCLTLHALRALSVNFGTDDSSSRRQPDDQMPSWPQAAFRALLSRSGCTLERIHLDLHISEPDLFGVMQSAGNALKELHVKGVWGRTQITTRFFMRLTLIPGMELCPLLQEVKLSHCDTDESSPTAEGQTITPEVLTRFLESRLSLVSNLAPLSPHKFLVIEGRSSRQGSDRYRTAIHDVLAAGEGLKLYMDYRFPR